MKMGEVFVLRDPTGDGKQARFDNYARGLFQEAYSMLAEDDALYVLHRRNLTRIPTRRPGRGRTLDRVALLPQAAPTLTITPTAWSATGPGASSSATPLTPTRQCPAPAARVRLLPAQPPKEIAFGFRNPFGWCSGPDGEVLLHRQPGRMGGDQQALPPGRRPVLRLPEPRSEAARRQTGRQDRGLGPL